MTVDKNTPIPAIAPGQFIPGDSPNYVVIGSWQIATGNSNPEEGEVVPCVAASIVPLNGAAPLTIIWPEYILRDWMEQFADARGKMIRSFPRKGK